MPAPRALLLLATLAPALAAQLDCATDGGACEGARNATKLIEVRTDPTRRSLGRARRGGTRTARVGATDEAHARANVRGSSWWREYEETKGTPPRPSLRCARLA